MKKFGLIALFIVALVGCQDAPADSSEAAGSEHAAPAEVAHGAHGAHKAVDPMAGLNAEQQALAKEALEGGGERAVGERIHDEARKLGRSDLCELVNAEMLRKTFALAEDTQIQNTDRPLLCSYLWMKDGRTYRLAFGFSPAKPSDQDAAQKQWDAVKLMASYRNSVQEDVEGLGDAAIWSTFDGGQLRVLSGSDIFHITLVQSESAWIAQEAGVTPPNVEQMSADEVEQARNAARADSKTHAIELAKEVLAKL